MRDIYEDTLKLSQVNYIGKFSIEDVKNRITSLTTHFNFTEKQSPKIDEDKKYMAKVSYAFAVGGLIYVNVWCLQGQTLLMWCELLAGSCQI